MKTLIISDLLLTLVTLTFAQERCDAPSPAIYCNSTSILAYESSSCTPYHVFLARGSDEPYPGRLGNLTSEICSGIGGAEKCTFESVQYPAKSTAWGPTVWCDSAGKGARAGQKQMKAYSEKCPDAKLIVLGFSQGGAVMQDVLGGGKVFACEVDENPALDATTAPGSNVVAAVTFGAVIRSKNQNFTVGAGVNFDGQASRTPEQLAGLNAYSDRLLDYCHYGDPMCAVGSNPPDVEQHLDYFLEHNEEVKSWVVNKAKGEGVGKPEQSGSVSVSASVTTSSVSKTTAKATESATKLSSGAATATATAAMTDGTQAAAAQTSATAATGAAGSLSVAVGYMMGLTFAVVAFLQMNFKGIVAY